MTSLRPQVHVAVPVDPIDPIVVSFSGLEIECALCRRDSFVKRRGLDPLAWGVTGVYVLIGPPEDAGTATSGPSRKNRSCGRRRRSPEAGRCHASGSSALDWWTRVLLVRRPGSPFDSARPASSRGNCTGFGNAERVMRVGQPNYDDSLPQFRRDDLGRLVSGVAAALEVLGVQLEPRPICSGWIAFRLGEEAR